MNAGKVLVGLSHHRSMIVIDIVHSTSVQVYFNAPGEGFMDHDHTSERENGLLTLAVTGKHQYIATSSLSKSVQ